MFDDIARKYRKKSKKKSWYILPVSIAMHVAIIGSLVAASLWAVGDVQAPPITLVFQPPLAPPPPPPPPPKKQVEKKPLPEKPKPKPIDASEMIAPTEVPPEPPKEVNLPVEETTAGEGSEEFGVDGGMEGGSRGGPPGGLPGMEPPPAPEPEKIIRSFTGAKRPVVIHKVDPTYPLAARAAGIEGRVILEAIINKEGRIVSVKVLSGHPLLSDSAVKAVKQWIFQPATIEGTPVKCYFSLKVEFHINKR
jgi:protein TonB